MINDAIPVLTPIQGLDEVSARFNDGSVTECYSCEYSEGKDGSVSGAPFCGDSM